MCLSYEAVDHTLWRLLSKCASDVLQVENHEKDCLSWMYRKSDWENGYPESLLPCSVQLENGSFEGLRTHSNWLPIIHKKHSFLGLKHPWMLQILWLWETVKYYIAVKSLVMMRFIRFDFLGPKPYLFEGYHFQVLLRQSFKLSSSISLNKIPSTFTIDTGIFLGPNEIIHSWMGKHTAYFHSKMDPHIIWGS